MCLTPVGCGLFTVDLALVDNWGYTAWDYARVRQLHYCMLIIASYIRQRNKNNNHNDSMSDDPSEQGDWVTFSGKRNAEENLGMGNLQVCVYKSKRISYEGKKGRTNYHS